MQAQRIVVGGTTGSGKTTLAGSIAERLDIPHVELDALNWGPNWTARPVDVFRASVDAATREPAWVVDGNYSAARDIIWPRSQLIVWLDYPLPIILWRLWVRTWRRNLSREVLWNDNVDRFLIHFTSRESLFYWAITTYRRRRRTYRAAMENPPYPNMSFVRLGSPRQAERWLAQI